jgi:hypothetical protein
MSFNRHGTFRGTRIPMDRETRERHIDTPYRFACPTCAAPAFHWCVYRNGARRQYEHRTRTALGEPQKTESGNGRHLITPQICSGKCRCGDRCALYAGHRHSKIHSCQKHFSYDVGYSMPTQP